MPLVQVACMSREGWKDWAKRRIQGRALKSPNIFVSGLVTPWPPADLSPSRFIGAYKSVINYHCFAHISPPLQQRLLPTWAVFAKSSSLKQNSSSQLAYLQQELLVWERERVRMRGREGRGLRERERETEPSLLAQNHFTLLQGKVWSVAWEFPWPL